MESYEKILIIEDEFLARLLEEILTEREIPHVLKTYHDLAYDGLFQTQKGWGHVEAPRQYKEQIAEIYRDIARESEDPEGEDEEESI